MAKLYKVNVEGRENSLGHKKEKISFLLVFALAVFLLLYKLGENPYGFFCDEALLGLRAQQLFTGDLDGIKPFFYEHFNYLLGNLSLFAVLPSVLLFGLTQFSVRVTSVIFALLTIVMILAIAPLYFF